MKTRNIFILYGLFAVGLFGIYQYKAAERQRSAEEAKLRSQAVNKSINSIIEKSNVVLKILEETQVDLEKTSKDLKEVRELLETRAKNEK